MDEQKIRELGQKIEDLEYHIQVLKDMMIYEDGKSFNTIIIENRLSNDQVNKILDLMDDAANSIDNKTPIDHAEFERTIYEIVPERRNDYHLAEAIVENLRHRDRYATVYKYMKTHGMNLT